MRHWRKEMGPAHRCRALPQRCMHVRISKNRGRREENVHRHTNSAGFGLASWWRWRGGDPKGLERVVLGAILDQVFSPETLAFLNRKVNEALAAATIPPADDLRKKRQAELAHARKEQENIEAAIRQGIITPTTKRMLLETETRIAHLEAALSPEPNRKVLFLPGAVEMCLRDLRGTLGTDPDYARGLLVKLIDSITLRKEGDRLFADVRGNITGLLGLDSEYDNHGAGRGILSLSPRPRAVRIVA